MTAARWICSVCGELDNRTKKEAHLRATELLKKDPHPGKTWEVTMVIPSAVETVESDPNPDEPIG